MLISVIVLFIVFVLIAVRQVGNVTFQIWQIMLGGACTVVLTGQISLQHALLAINKDVMLFLFGMFIVGQALEKSGYLSHLSYKMFRRARSTDQLVLFILFGMGMASAFLMNDTLAIIGTPVVLLLAKKHGMSPKVLLLALAFAVTIGSVVSPIGNPQNLLIAVNGNIPNPFITFLHFLLLPTMLNLFVAYLILRFFYRPAFHQQPLNHAQEPIKDHQLAVLSKVALRLIVIGVIAKVISVFLGNEFRLTYIALIAAFPIMLSHHRLTILKQIDWQTLIFFAAMFVLMESVWEASFFQSLMTGNITSPGMVLAVSVLLSQLISNVPLVALSLPMLQHAGAGTKEMVALAAGSTIAGNLLILGAASNVIIIQNAEKKGETVTFWEFAKVGVPLTALNVMVYWFLM